MATTAVDHWLIDTNILVFAYLTHHPLYGAARTRLQTLAGAGAELWLSRQILREYLAAMTRPRQYTGAIPLASLIADVQAFEQSYHVAEDNAAVTARLLNLIEAVPCIGKQIHDANIVATMQEYGIQNLLTDNTADFARFGHLITVLALVP
jgi:predicted nucleic acid-binding protein